jgi:hypothetical protein
MTTLPRRHGARYPAWCGVAAAAVVAVSATGCGSVPPAAPTCTANSRLAIVAQSVTGAAYVPCIRTLPTGWEVVGFHVARGHTNFRLLSDRAGGRPVAVSLRAHCSIAGATPTTPRADGVRTYLRLTSVSPRYAGTMSDVFPGGCVTYEFDFSRGPHIGLMEDLTTAVGLFSRRELKFALHRDLGVELDP